MRISDTPWFRPAAVALLVVLGVWAHFQCARQGWEISGLMGHGFRQAQTALSIDAMRQDGFRLDYATPVLGKPWSIPMEFPLYQWLAVQVSAGTGWPTAQAGRAVSLAAFYLALPAFWLALRAIGAGRARAGLLLLPVLAAPVYLFYSRAVLIESLALAGAAWFLACALQWIRRGGGGWLTGAWLAGAVAALVKGTTWAVFLVPLAAALLAEAVREKRPRAFVLAAGRGLLVAGPPLVLGLAWVALADRIKAENPLATFLVSGNLAAFNFGSLTERLGPSLWAEIGGHWCRTAMPWWALLVAAVALVLAPPRWRWPALVALGGFLAGPLVFSNLYRIHDYYHYATTAFLVLAAGMALLGLAEAGGWRRWFGVSGFAVLLVGQGCTYRREYFGPQTQPFAGAGPLALQIEQLTLPRDVIVVHGTDWSSELPYYAKRRALVVPDGQLAIAPAAVEANIRLLRDEHVALVVFTGPASGRPDLIAQRVRDFALWPTPLFTLGEDTVVYAAESDMVRMTAMLRTDTPAPGVRVCAGGPVVASSPELQPLGARRFAGAFPDFKPTPESGVLPFGYILFNDHGRRVFVANVPTELHFPVTPGAREVALDYRVFEEAFAKPDFGGIRFVVELRGPGGETTLLDDWIGADAPAPERGLRQRVLALPGGAAGTVVFRSLPGDTGNAAFGWALLERFEVR